MFRTMRRILTAAIERQESDTPNPRNWLIDRRDEGARCARCGGTLERAVVAGRTTYYCRDHQHR